MDVEKKYKEQKNECNIKEIIKNANTIEELNNIVIDYEIELSNTDTKPVGINTPEGIIFDNLNKVPKIGE